MRIKRAFWLGLIFVGALFVTAWVAIAYPNFFTSRKKVGNLVYFPKQNLEVSVEIAADAVAWGKGLMFRDSLPENSGMLFVFPDDQIRSFWMKNTKIPLDIIFISNLPTGESRIVDIKENFEPCPDGQIFCPSYVSKQKAIYVLEAGAGFVSKYKIQEGDIIRLITND